MKPRVVVLGAGFGGLELCTILSDGLGERLDVTLIDKSDSFVFGFSRLDIMFEHATPESVRFHYHKLVKPGVTFRQEKILNIDPVMRRVTTTRGIHEADVLIVALGADFDLGATPGLAEGGNEFYSLAGAELLRRKLREFSRGRAIVGVTSTPYKCPPAPCEAVLMLHDYLMARGVHRDCELTLVLPLSAPVPPSSETSEALLASFAERGITFIPNRSVAALDPAKRTTLLDDGTELPYDLFLGVPRHRAPEVVAASGMTENGWIPVNPATLETRFPGVYALGDVSSSGVPKSGVFAESAARVVAQSLLAQFGSGEPPAPFEGTGSCYLELGGGRVGRVDVNFLSGPSVTAVYTPACAELAAEKKLSGSSREARWFGV